MASSDAAAAAATTTAAATSAPRKRRGTDLGEMLENVAKLAKGTAEKTHLQQHLTPKGAPVPDEIYKYLVLMRRIVANMDEERNTVEVEARLGMLAPMATQMRQYSSIPGSGAVTLDHPSIVSQQLEWHSGVSAPSFEEIGARLIAAGGRAEASEERVYTYKGDNNNGVRCIVRGNTLRREKKMKVMNLERTFALPSAPYDLRVSVATEAGAPDGVTVDPNANPESNVYGDPVAAGWESLRSKERLSYTGFRLTGAAAGLPSYWRLDLTRVTSWNSEGDSEDTLEVEMELQSEVQRQWVSDKNDENHNGQTEALSLQLVALVELLNPLEPLSSIANPLEEKDLALAAAARERCLELRRSATGRGGRGGGSSEGDQKNDRNSFPGAMPANLCRNLVPSVQKGDYFISEKTDGVRYLLVICKASNGRTGCVLVDRKMSVFTIEGGDALAAALTLQGGEGGAGTVLDGELVHHRGQDRAIFMVFDMLAWGNLSYMAQPFRTRFRTVRDTVLPAYSRAALPLPHLPLVAKRWFPRLGISDLWACIKEHGGERIYEDTEGRVHKTDGVIFQPNTPYRPGTDHRLLKWKWKDLASVDLRVVRFGGQLKLETEGPNKVPIDLTEPLHPIVRLAQHDIMRLNADLRASPKATIVEVAMHESTGLWRYMGQRPDKDRPNFMTTVMGTLVELAEGMSPHELLYRMMCRSPAEDDWTKQAYKMGQAAVDYRKKSLATAMALLQRPPPTTQQR